MNCPTVSVIIPVYDDSRGLMKCLDALDRQTLPKEQFEVLIVDNGSTEPIRKVVAEFSFATYLFEGEPGSYCARNSGFAVAKGRYVAFTDADCIPDSAWLAKAVSCFEADPEACALGGAVHLKLSGSPTAAELYQKVFGFRQAKYISENGFAVTANLIVRRAIFVEIGGFDETLLSGGDKDWGHRLHMAGEKIQYAADVVVEHPARATLADLIRKRRRVEAGRMAVAPISKRYPNWMPSRYLETPRGARMGMSLAFNPISIGLKHPQGWQVLFVVGVMKLVVWLEQVRLRLGGVPERR